MWTFFELPTQLAGLPMPEPGRVPRNGSIPGQVVEFKTLRQVEAGPSLEQLHEQIQIGRAPLGLEMDRLSDFLRRRIRCRLDLIG